MNRQDDITSIENFIDSLANPSKLPEDGRLFTNMYAEPNSVQRKNLTLYLKTLFDRKPTMLLLGEAPGFHGCGKTGIPFTDEFHLYEEPSNPGYGKLIGAGEKYSGLHAAHSIQREKEVSATTMWDALDAWDTPPLMWNVFPYHPHKGDNTKTNRTPSAKEVAFGWHYVAALMNIFGIPAGRVYCVGATAHNALRANMPLVAHYVRHPSYGGKEECKAQLEILRTGGIHE